MTDISVQNAQSQVTDFRSFANSSGVFFSTDLSLRTEEGDVVELSFDSERAFAESESQTQLDSGLTVQEFSSVSVAASRYSQVVQGDLNEEELEAIRQLASRIEPIAVDFFSGNDFDLEAAGGSLAESLGVISELELRLEKTVVQTFSAEAFTRLNPAEDVNPEKVVDPAQLQAPVENSQVPVDSTRIRDLGALVLATIESEFEAQAANFLDNETLARSLGDLLDMIREQIGRFLEPLSNSPELNPDQPVEPEADITPESNS